MTEARLAVPLPQKFVEEPQTAGALHLGQHPVGGSLGSSCPLCNHALAAFNSARFCHCNVFSHYKCLIYRLRGTTVEDHRKCDVCGTAYILYFEDRAALRPFQQCTFLRALCLLIWMAMVGLLCLILIDVFSHALEDGESLYEEYSYLIFAAYTGIFVVVTLGCCMNIIFESRSTLITMEPYHTHAEGYHQNAGEEGYDLVANAGSREVNVSEAPVKPGLKELQEPQEKA